MVNQKFFSHVVLLVLLAIVWGSSFTGIKVAIETIPPLTLVAIRLLVAGIMLYAVSRYRRMSLLPFSRQWITLFILGLTSNTLPFFLISWGEQGIDSGAAAILMAIMPLVTIALAHFFTEDDYMTPIKFIGLIIGFGGIAILVGLDAFTKLGDGLIFELSVVGGALFYAISAVLTRRLPSGGNPVQRAVSVVLCSIVQIIPLCLIIDMPWLLNPSVASINAAIYLGIFPTAIGALIYFHLIQERGTTFFASINYMVPCAGVLLGLLMLGEDLEVRSIIALVVTLSGVFITNTQTSRYR